MCGCLSTADGREIENEACTILTPDDTPLVNVISDLGTAIRAKHPLPNAAAVPKLKWDGEQSP